MSTPIYAGGHVFHQTVSSQDARGRPSGFVWTCQRCGVAVDPSDPYTNCKGEKK